MDKLCNFKDASTQAGDETEDQAEATEIVPVPVGAEADSPDKEKMVTQTDAPEQVSISI